VAAVTLVYRSGTMVMPFLPLYLAIERGIPVRMTGLYLGLWGAGGVIGALVGGRIAEWLGNARTMGLALFGAGIGFVVLGAMRDPWAIGIVLLLTSIAAEGFRTPSSSVIAAAVGPDIRARAFALRRLAINLGMAIGPAVGGVLATIGYGWLFLVDGATCLLAAVAAVLLLFARDEDKQSSAVGIGSPGSLWQNGMFIAALGCAALMTLAFGQLFATYPLTLKQNFGHSEPVIGAAFALNTLLIVAFEMVLQHRLAPCRPLLIITGGSLTLALGYLLVQSGPGLAVVFLAMSVLTVGEMLVYPVIESYVIGIVPRATMSRAIGALNATFAATFVLAPIAGTLLYDGLGYRSVWLTCAGITILSAAGFLIMEIRASLSEPLRASS
jgi:MFS family permease